ncbi:MAG: hypothetical protein ACI88Z_002063, partial [Sphingobacteriales bacterium]
MFQKPILIFDENDDDANLFQAAIKEIDPMVNTIITKVFSDAKKLISGAKEDRPMLVFVEI